jgi:hypothetical protein
VNPAHLYLGTHEDNTADMWARGRANHVRGEQSGTAKLTEEDVHRIRELRRTTLLSFRKIGRLFGVSDTTIRYVVSGRKWAHIKASLESAVRPEKG